MKPRVCFSERTPPLPAEAFAFAKKPADNPALRRLISVGLVALSLWLCWLVFAGAVARFGLTGLDSGWKPVESRPDPQAPLGSNPTASTPSVALAHLERALPVLKRALPVPGAHYPATLPDGQVILTTWKGTLANFSQLPAHPALGDEFGVKEGQGASWIWATPLGWNHPAWIDP